MNGSSKNRVMAIGQYAIAGASYLRRPDVHELLMDAGGCEFGPGSYWPALHDSAHSARVADCKR